MTDAIYSPRFQLIGMLAIAAATAAAFWVAEGPEAAIFPAVLISGFALLVHFGRRRSDTLDVMSGIGDERTRTLYTRAVALTGTVLSLVLPGWWLVTVALGEPNETLALVCALFGVTFIGSVAVLARRG
jgi:uncharacterized membrane protein